MNRNLVSIIGSGSFGTSIAQVLSKNFKYVRLFGRDDEVNASINNNQINNRYHPLIKLNKNITAYSLFKYHELLQESDLIFFCVPSGVVREIARFSKGDINKKIIISAAKGIEYPSLKYMTTLIREELNSNLVFSLSGPTFADELIRNNLSGMTLGIDNYDHRYELISSLSTPNLIIDTSENVNGVELCGVLKNIYAVALGIFDSLITSNNAHYTFLNLAFKEMNYVLSSLALENLSSLFCGFGDFSLTSNIDKSRNRTLGLIIGKNISIELARSTITFESIKSAKSIEIIANESDLNVPIIHFINAAFVDPHNIRENMKELLITLANTSP